MLDIHDFIHAIGHSMKMYGKKTAGLNIMVAV